MQAQVEHIANLLFHWNVEILSLGTHLSISQTHIKISLAEHFQSSSLASDEAPCPCDAESYVATAAPPPPTRDANRIRYKDGRGDWLGGGGRIRIRGEERGSGEEANLTTKALLRSWSVGCSLVVAVAVALFVSSLRKRPHEMRLRRSSQRRYESLNALNYRGRAY